MRHYPSTGINMGDGYRCRADVVCTSALLTSIRLPAVPIGTVLVTKTRGGIVPFYSGGAQLSDGNNARILRTSEYSVSGRYVTFSSPPSVGDVYSVDYLAPQLIVGGAAFIALTDPYADAVLADSPLGYWRADDTGATMADLTGNGHAATFDAGTTKGDTPLRNYSSGCISRASNGRAAYLGGLLGTDIGNISLLSSSAYTLEAIVKKTGGGSVMACCLGGDAGGSAGQAPGIVYRSTGLAHAVAKFTSVEVVSPNSTAGSAIHLVMAVTTTNGCKLYENGTLVVSIGSGLGTGNFGTLEFLGSASTPSSLGFIGSGCDFAVYNYELSAARALVHAQWAGFA